MKHSACLIKELRCFDVFNCRRAGLRRDNVAIKAPIIAHKGPQSHGQSST